MPTTPESDPPAPGAPLATGVPRPCWPPALESDVIPACSEHSSGRLVMTLFYRGDGPTPFSAWPDSPQTVPSGAGDSTAGGSNVVMATWLSSLATVLGSLYPQHDQTIDPADHVCRVRALDQPHKPRVVEVTMDLALAPTRGGSGEKIGRNEQIAQWERQWHVDVVAIQPDRIWRRLPRLIAFDMDGTLIREEVIDLLAATATDRPELGSQIADITRRAMAGELEFAAAFRERVGLLRGINAARLVDLRSQVTITKGAQPLMRALRRLGVKTTILSGGFDPVAHWLSIELGHIDSITANRVMMDSGENLTGVVDGSIVGPDRKAEELQKMAEQEGIDMLQTVAIGDGANDLPMLAMAGLGVGWGTNPALQGVAGGRLTGDSLLELLYLFGYTGSEIEQLCEQ